MYILSLFFWKEPAKSEEMVVANPKEKEKPLTDIGIVNNGFSTEKENGGMLSQSNSVVANGKPERDGVAESTYMWYIYSRILTRLLTTSLHCKYILHFLNYCYIHVQGQREIILNRPFNFICFNENNNDDDYV